MSIQFTHFTSFMVFVSSQFGSVQTNNYVPKATRTQQNRLREVVR